MALFSLNAQPFPNGQILDSTKLKEFADNTFRYDENASELPKWVENTVGKGGIARHEQFLLSPTVFSEDLYGRHVKTRASCLEKG